MHILTHISQYQQKDFHQITTWVHITKFSVSVAQGLERRFSIPEVRDLKAFGYLLMELDNRRNLKVKFT